MPVECKVDIQNVRLRTPVLLQVVVWLEPAYIREPFVEDCLVRVGARAALAHDEVRRAGVEDFVEHRPANVHLSSNARTPNRAHKQRARLTHLIR